ncbi:beta-defensin-like [Crotalus adamanteus]|uniref:Beta-defensin-like n=1 Tax=Crotalus adamanteus TaxID=8729 RepID=A0AAW1BU42_CROAD
MKILYLLFAFLFLAFLSEPGNAQRQCFNLQGSCRFICPLGTTNSGEQDCEPLLSCCIRTRGK